jgi:hypothetical protein
VAHQESYNALPHDYGCSFKTTQHPSIFEAEIGGLTRSGRCFTLEELEKKKES